MTQGTLPSSPRPNTFFFVKLNLKSQLINFLMAGPTCTVPNTMGVALLLLRLKIEQMLFTNFQPFRSECEQAWISVPSFRHTNTGTSTMIKSS